MGQYSYNEIIEKPRKAVVSLLIPKKHWNRFESLKIKENKSSADLLNHLLQKYQSGKNINLANRVKLTTQYQAGGLGLKKHSFWVDPLLWHRFKNLARFYGVSICFLFTALFCMLEKLGTDIKNYPPFVVKLYERVNIPFRIAIRRYKIDTS